MTPADAAWLEALAVLLAPCGCGAIAWVPIDAGAADGRCPRLPAPAQPIHAASAGFVDGEGLLVRVADPSARASALFVRVAGAEAADAYGAAITALCRLAWRMRSGIPAGDAGADVDPQREAVHGLRNALNAIGMSSAVLAGRRLPPELLPFAQDLERAVGEGVARLQQLAQTLPR